MKLSEYFKNTNNVSISNFAKKIGVSRNVVYQWVNNIRPVPINRCRSIVVETNGSVTFSDLRPDDWHLIWDEPLPRSLKQSLIKNS